MNAWLLQSAIQQTKESILEETKEQLQQEYVVVVWGFFLQVLAKQKSSLILPLLKLAIQEGITKNAS
ncbi:hypothetical protein AO9_02055 [Chlamydia psittaci Mat116]|nr:hypothetical protein AO9_02055 [Chlamydia psittaci Mat116]